MQVLVVVNLLAFMLGVLLLFSVLTPHDRRRTVNGKEGPAHALIPTGVRPSQSIKGESQ